MDLALDNLQWLTCHKTKPNHYTTSTYPYIYIYIYIYIVCMISNRTASNINCHYQLLYYISPILSQCIENIKNEAVFTKREISEE